SRNTVHQKKSADSRKLACCQLWIVLSTSAALKKAGTCQTQSAKACTIHATSELVRKFHGTAMPDQRTAFTTDPRQCSGNAHIHTPKGRLMTISGAATIIMSSCCTICALNNCTPSASTGDTRAM